MMQKSPIGTRCPACQLQLCKSRSQVPHASLTEVRVEQTHAASERYFTCKACGTTLINSDDRNIPGWRSMAASAMSLSPSA
jgi:hypothetical protein